MSSRWQGWIWLLGPLSLRCSTVSRGRPLDWNLSFVLRCLSRSPFQLLKLASDKHLTWKTSFLLALVLAKRVSELHGLSFSVCHLRSGSPVPSRSFLTSWRRPSILPFLTLILRNSQYRPLMTSWEMTGMNCCSVSSGPFRNNCPERSLPSRYWGLVCLHGTTKEEGVP